jgi:predicted phosphodiesterase
MKTVTIGDTHGAEVADVVGEIIDDHDKFIFVGDYVDSFFYDNVTMKKNLLDIIELKKKYPEKIVLLWGNHDIQYLLGVDKYGCTGYRPEMQHDFYEILNSNAGLFRFSYQIDDYL